MSTQTGEIYPEDEVLCQVDSLKSVMMHGSCIYNNYVYGVPRAYSNWIQPHNNNAIVKIKVDDYSDIALSPMAIEGQDLNYAEQIVNCGNYLYATTGNVGVTEGGFVIRIDPDTLDVVKLNAHNFVPDGLDSDGTFLYGSLGATVQKVNPETLEIFTCVIPDESYNDDAIMNYVPIVSNGSFSVSSSTITRHDSGSFLSDGWASGDKGFISFPGGNNGRSFHVSTVAEKDLVVTETLNNQSAESGYVQSQIPDNYHTSSMYGDFSYGRGAASHAVLVDNTYIWLNMLVVYNILPGNSHYSEWSQGYMPQCSRVHKIRKADMQYMGYAIVAQITDDMGQSVDHGDYSTEYIFCGHEPAGPVSYGWTWGASAIRKSDLAVFPLPKLGASDGPGVFSYSSLMFGNYLIDIKINNHLYVIDVTDPSSWSINSDPDDVVLFDFYVHDLIDTNDTTNNSMPHNEIVMDNYGKFHEFTWSMGAVNTAKLRRIVIPGLTFITPPILRDAAPSDIASTFAQLNGYMTSTGGRVVTQTGFVIGTSPGSYGSDIYVLPVPIGSFSLLVEGLTPGQTYYYKAFASNVNGRTYSNEISFVTLSSATNLCILGTVTKNSVSVEGATAFAVAVGVGTFSRKRLSGPTGRFAFTGLSRLSKYHAAVEYIDPQGVKWNAKSLPFLIPVPK